MTMRSMRVLSVALAASVAKADVPSCKSDEGSDVDFSYAFKYPGGWDYAYMDSDKKLAKVAHALNTRFSSVTKVVEQIDKDVNYVVWNDEPAPDGSSESPSAHAKG